MYVSSFISLNKICYYIYYLVIIIPLADIRIDWRIFKEDQDSERPLDFIVSYGKLFPEKDSNGEEVVPSFHGK